VAARWLRRGPRTEAEDCLFVNVQRPTGLGRRDRRPVYVFIHGGGLVNGSSNQADMAANQTTIARGRNPIALNLHHLVEQIRP